LRVTNLEADLEKERTRVKDLTGDVEVLRAGVTAEKARADELETKLAATERVRAKVEAERDELARAAPPAEPEPTEPRRKPGRIRDNPNSRGASPAEAAGAEASPPRPPRAEEGSGGAPP